MVRAPQHTFQVLTKRHERLAELAPAFPGLSTSGAAYRSSRRFVKRAGYLREARGYLFRYQNPR
jgi:protein gp37